MKAVLEIIKSLLLSMLLVAALLCVTLFIFITHLDNYHPGPDVYSTGRCEDMYLTRYFDEGDPMRSSGYLLVCNNFNIDCWTDSFALKLVYRYIDSVQKPIHDGTIIEIVDDKLIKNYEPWERLGKMHDYFDDFSTIRLQFFADWTVKKPLEERDVWVLIYCNGNKYEKYRHINKDDPNYSNISLHKPRYLLPDSLYYLYREK